jgi:hypothetical protein
VETTENVGKQRSWLSAAKKNGVSAIAPVSPVVQTEASISQVVVEDFPPVSVERSEVESVEVETPAAAPAPALEPMAVDPRPRFIDRFKNRPVAQSGIVAAVVEEPVAVPAAAEQPAPEPVAVEIKPERPSPRAYNDRDPAISLDSAAGDIRFRLSYAGLVAIGFIFVLLLAIAFIAGRQMSSQSAFEDSGTDSGIGATGSSGPATAPTSGLMIGLAPANTPANTPVTEDAMPVRADVLSVPSRGNKPAAVSKVNTSAVNTSAIPATSAPPLPIKATRDIGMVYVVVQSYAEQELAQKACDFMNHAGIPCSLVQGPAHWAPGDWYSVVGLQPFTKHDPSLADYERAVRALGVKFTTHPIDQFQPAAYTWREDSDMSQP